MAQSKMTGTVTSTHMKGSVVVEVVRKVPHKLYKKLVIKSKKYIADSRGMDVQVGQKVHLVETRKMGAHKHFKVEGGTK